MANVQKIKVTQTGAEKTANSIKKVDKSISGLTKSALKYASAAGAIAVAVKSMQLTKLASDAINVEKAFRNLAKEPENLLKSMKKAVGGTITEFELMKKFNEAALLGLPLDRFDEMLTIARSSAQATGASMEFMLNSIVTGIGRQSKLMIDNLGILVSVESANADYAATLGKLSGELTDIEKKQAFANAVLDAGAENLEAMGGASEGAFDGVNKLTSLIADSTTNAFKNLVKPIDDAANAIAELILLSDAAALSSSERSEKMMKDEFFRAVVFNNVAEAAQNRADAEKKAKDEEKLRSEAALFALTGEADGNLRLDASRMTLAQGMAIMRAEAKKLFEINQEEIPLLDALTLAENDLTTARRDTAAASLESGLKGLAMSQNLGDASRALANQYIVEGVFGAVKGALTSLPFPANILAAGAAGIAANALFNSIVPAKAAATGADFVTNGPELLLVGDNPGGRESVQVTPMGSPNINGPQGGVTINISGDFIGTDDFVETKLIPSINRAVNQGRANIA